VAPQSAASGMGIGACGSKEKAAPSASCRMDERLHASWVRQIKAKFLPEDLQ
jgi:hypothetical protein